MLLAYGVVTGVSDSIVVEFDEVDVGVKGGFDLYSFNLRLKPPCHPIRSSTGNIVAIRLSPSLTQASYHEVRC